VSDAAAEKRHVDHEAQMCGLEHRLHDAERTALRHGEEAVAATEDYVKHNPWQSVGIAAAVGVVLGVLLARR
jgi:ElaB/YqjD/DUF883 family membrane-anchored ribosome-binding protein